MAEFFLDIFNLSILIWIKLSNKDYIVQIILTFHIFEYFPKQVFQN